VTIDALIDKQDSFEIVRDRIAAILATEVASQMQLATAAGKDPSDWKLRIFSERSNPWEQFLDATGDQSPVINVWYESSVFPPGKSNLSERQTSETTYNIDCIGFGISKDGGGAGHLPGDRAAAFEVHRALRLVRNILMASDYAYLGLKGTVGHRWPQSVTVFQPQLDGSSIQKIDGARIALKVSFNEFSPQATPSTLELLSVDVFRAEDGEILLEADYDYPAP